MTTNAALIEALVKLVDEYRQLDGSRPVSTFDLIEDIDAKQDGIQHWPLDGGYQTLLEQGKAMILRHFGASFISPELTAELHRSIDDLEENAND